MRVTLFGQDSEPMIGEGATSRIASSYPLRQQSMGLQPKPVRVAAYVRVSTLSTEQEDSLETQTNYYTRHIRSNPYYQMVGIYSDQGKSGTMTTGRSGFNRLMRHALEGKIDLILCKSVSRFARNVLDTLDTVRMLKENGVRVIFEKEDIDTENMQSEFILTMMAAVAEEESHSISQNIKWSNLKRLERGEPSFRRLLGYVRDKDEKWVIHQKEANIVREAFELCIEGRTPPEIARLFMRKGYETSHGNKEWSGTAIREILRNTQYIGEVIGQKTYTRDHISHKSRKNKGERNIYLISDHHEPIVDKEIFEQAQVKLNQRNKRNKGGSKSSYPLSSRIVCGTCGGNLQRFVCRGVVTWRCGKRIKSNQLCSMSGIREENVVNAMVVALKRKYEPTEQDEEEVRKTILKMKKDIKNTEMKGDAEYNQLQIKVEKILFEESKAILEGQDELLEGLRAKRAATELELKEKEEQWNLIEADSAFRKDALEKLEKMSFPDVTYDRLIDEFSGIEYVRAWVIRVKALSPFLFAFTWITGEVVKVDLKKEMIPIE
ncbi:recombinase family protein [Heliorestis acidaminivorans]|uniref:Recombinase family protein n=1 Tax=Heliorestis acidaminivorans TaxID=553427 RepID=A0A6I0EU44_9FIRM|nr:recombinase family protein [Heliorestis acidaminivorans]KAB2953714.1 recombinase family protein [Heliorestis acidaminivorans]